MARKPKHIDMKEFERSQHSKDPFVRLSTPTPVGHVTQISVAIPKPWKRILDTEATFLGTRPSQFLELLVLARLGLQPLTRSPLAPTYKVDRREMEKAKTVRFIWYMRPALKKLFDEHRMLKLGNMAISAWVLMALSDWIGLNPRPPGADT